MSFDLPYINKITKFFAIFVALSGLCLHGYGQAVGDYQTNATGSWNWSTTANWQRWNGTTWVAPGANGYPGQNAGTGTVTILNNHNVTLNVSPANNVVALTINPGANATALAFGGFTLNVTGDVNVNNTTTNIAKSIALNTGTLNCNNLYLTSSGGNDNRDAFVVLTTGTLNVTGNITMSAVASRTYIRFNGGGTVNVGGTITGGTITSAAGGGGSVPTSGTVVYNYAGAQNVGTYAYYNLGISGSGNKAIQGNISVAGTLTLTAGTLTIGTNTLTLNGPAIAGTPSNLSTTSLSSLVFGGTSAGVLIPTSVVALNNLTISNTSIVTLQSSPTISGIFNPGGGGLSIGNNTLTLNGQVNCGTLVGGANSNIVIGGSGTASLSAVTLNNLTINRATSMCGNVTVDGTLTLSSGALTVTTYTLTLNGPAIAGTPTNLTTTSSSSLVFGGTAAGISVPSSVSNLNNLTVNNSSGITLSGGVTVAGILTMMQGNITTGTYTLIISNGVVGSLNRVSGTIIGRLTRAVNTPLSTDYIFPVGTASFYRPAIMNFSSLSAGTNITIEFISTPPAGFTAYTDDVVYLNNTFTEGYWRFFSSGLPAATYSLGLTGDGFTSYTINGNTRITGRDNDNSTWRALGSHGTQSGNDVSRNGVTNLNTTSFDFALATGCLTALMSYGYARNITIDYTKVSGGADLYNFPVLVYITGQNFLRTSPTGQILNANGYDIIFTDNNYNKLDHQLEYYNGTSGELIAWVRIPTLSSSLNTVIKILYGNPQITADPSANISLG